MSTPESDTRDRVIALEIEVTHLQKTVDDMSAKVTAMHDMLQQARGAKWLFIVVWLGVGSAATYALQFVKFIGIARP
ncbi:MAG: hypothetical protein RLZZ129_647 [Verrucomicrobiota bacterium]